MQGHEWKVTMSRRAAFPHIPVVSEVELGEDICRSVPTMRASFLSVVAVLSLALPFLLRADPAGEAHLSSDQMAAEASALQWQTGTITLKDGLAKIELKPGYRFLDGPQAEKVLHDLWGNPPGEPPLGMIFPPDTDPLQHGSWSVVVEYEEGGHVNDDDAAKINYDDLLKQMQQTASDANAERQRLGYPTVQLVGWAQEPRYDAATHKLYWAKDLRFEDESTDTLNYDVRVLGRKGVLVLRAISHMNNLDTVSAQIPDVMAMVDFNPGNTYAEFDPRVDKVAKYGIAALVAGTAVGIAAKAGMLKFLLPLLLALKKVAVIVVVAVVALAKKIGVAIRGRSSVARPFDPPKSGGDPTSRGVPVTPTLNAPPPPHNDPLRPPPTPPGGGIQR